MMSQPNNNMSVIKASIDYLSSKFDQLLDDHQNILMKQRQDNANILNQKHGVDPKLFNNLFQEQEHIQNSIEFLAQLEESYHNEARHLKDLIIDDYQNFRHSNQSSENVKGLRDPITALKSYIEINLGSLQTKVLSADGMEQLEIQVMRKLQTYFNEAFNGMEEAFMNYSNMSKKYSGKNAQQYDPIQIEQFCSHNFLTIESAAGGLDSIQQILLDHNEAMGSLASKYKKESKLLQENLNHIKQRLYAKTKEASEHRTSIRSSSGFKQDRTAEKSTKSAIPSFDSKELLLMDQLVTQVIATNAYKNEVFNAIKKAADSLQFRLQEKIDSLAGNLKTLKETGGTLRESVAESKQERRSVKKSLTPPKRIARCPSQENTSFMDQSSKKKRQVGGGSTEKKEQKKPSPSPIRSKSPQQPQREQKIYKTKSVGKLHQENPRLSDKEVDLLAKELRRCQNQFESYSNTMDQKLLKLHHNAQKFLNSSEKIAELVNRRGEEEIYALKIYQHDYTILRDSLNKLFVSHEAHQERRNSPTRSARQELLKQRERSAKRLGTHLTTEQTFEESNERRPITKEEGNDKKINEIMHNLEKAQTDILKTIYRDESYIHKTLETDEDFQLRGREKGSQGRLKTEKSLQELSKFNQDGDQDLEKKFEKLLQESDILKKENEELYKKARKVREKADERKKTLKQLFELVMEKDKDINAYKEALKGKGEGIQKKKDDIAKVFEAKSNELLLKVGYLEKKLLDKEFKLKSLTELTQKLMQTRQIKESKSAKSGLKLPKSGSRDELRDSGKKTRQSPEIKGKNKATLDEAIEIKDYINKEADNILSLINPKVSSSLQALTTVEHSLEILKAEKKELEEKYHQMLEEMGKIHEDKSKLESEHQQELSQLREKVKNLHEKVSGGDDDDDQFKTPQKSNKVEQDVVQETTNGTKVKEALNERILELSKDIREGVEEYRRNPVESAEKSQDFDFTKLNIEIAELKKINKDLTVQIQIVNEEKDKEVSSLNELVSILRKEIEDINGKYLMKQEPLAKDNKALKAQIENINIKVNGIFEWMKEGYKGPSSSFIEENLEKLQVIIKQRETQQKDTIDKIHNRVKEDQARESEKFRVLKEENSKIITENNEKIAQLEILKKQLDEKINKVKELKQKIIEHEVANIELQQAMSILKEDLQSKENSINTQRKDLTAKITELEVLVENYKNAIGSQNNELAENNVKLETRIKELEELIAKKEGEVESKKKNLAMKNLEVQSLAERLAGSESTLQIYKHDLNTKEEELAVKTREYENKINDLNAQIVGYKKEIESENEKRKSLEEKIIKLEGSVENVRNEKTSKDNDYELKIQEYESRIQDLESTKEAQKLDIISLANDLNTQKDSFIDNIQELEKTIESLKEEASLKTEKFIQDLAVYQAKIQELEVLNETQKTGFEQELKEAKTSHQALTETMDIREKDFQKQKVDHEVKLSELQSQKAILEQELKKANTSYEETINVKENDFKQKKEAYKAKLAELESQKTSLEQELKEAKAGHQALIEAMNVKEYDFNQQKEGSEAKFAQFESQRATLEQELREAKVNVEEAINAKDKQKDSYEAKILELETLMTSKNNSFSQQTEAYQKQIKDLQAKNEAQKLDILSRNNDLDTQSKDLRKKLSDYEVSISIYKEEAAVKDKDLKSQAKELEELKEKLKFKQAEIIAMDLDNQGLMTRLQMIEGEKTKIEAVLNLFDSQLSEFTHRYIAANEEQETQEETEEKSLLDFENNLQKRMRQLESLMQNRQLELEELAKMSEKERELLQKDKENLERRVQDIEINIARTIETCERLENETQILNEKNSELLTAKDKLEQELDKREVDVKSLTEELQALREAIRSAQEENAKIMEGAKEEEEDQEREINIILQSKTQLEAELENTKAMKDFTEKRVEELEQKIIEVEEMYNEKEKYAREVEVRCQGITDVLEELGEQRKKFIQDKNEERVRYEKKIKELKEEINRMAEHQENVIKVKKATPEGVDPEIKRLEENIRELKTENEAMQAELNKKNEDLKYMKEKSENLQAALQNAGKRISQLIEEKEELEKGIEEVDSQQGFDSMIEVDDRDRIIEELKQNIEETTNQLNDTLAQNQVIEEQLEKIKAELESKTSKFEKNESEFKNRIEGLLQAGLVAENDIEALKKEQEQVITGLNKKIEDLNIEVQAKEDKINELREASQKDNQALFQENDQLKEETKDKQLKIQELEEELEQLAGRWEEVKEKIEELQTSLSHKESLIVEINNLNSDVNEQVKKLQEEISESNKAHSADVEALNNKKVNIEKENLQLKEEMEKLREELQGTLTNKDQEIAKLNQTLQEKYKITVEYKDHQEEMETKNQKISELEEQVQELQQNLKTEASQKEALDNTIADLRREIEGDTGERLSQRDLQIDELTQRIATLEKSQLELSEENKVLRSITQRETRTRSGGEIDFNLDKSEIMCTSPNAEDDIKTKSYLTVNYCEGNGLLNLHQGNILNRSFDMNTKRLSEEEYIKELHEKTRALQDENEKLEAENKQLKSEHELSRIMDEDLRSDLVDKDEEMKRLQFQLVVLKEELSKADKKSQSQDSSPLMAPQSSMSHEKEHIRTIFSKFMESLSQGNSKEVEGLLKLLTSLLDFDETAKSQLMNGLKSKSSKKGMLGRLF